MTLGISGSWLSLFESDVGLLINGLLFVLLLTSVFANFEKNNPI
jgi:hypothetical protein